MLNEIQGFALGGDTVLKDFYDNRKRTKFNPDVLKISVLANQAGLSSLIQRDFDDVPESVSKHLKDDKLTEEAATELGCQIGEIASPLPNS